MFSFGMNNSLLQTQENVIKSEYLKLKRKQMNDLFRDLLFTSKHKREVLSKENEQKKVKAVINLNMEK